MPADATRLLTIDKLWEGTPTGPEERAQIAFALTPSGLVVEIAARFHDDPPPDTPPGRTEALWNHEVLELFVANERGEYLELEFGPHGHYLALLFSGAREVARRDIAVSCWTTISGTLWQARARVPRVCLPQEISRANAYAIHGNAESRRFLASSAVPGERPDFHQPRRFKPLSEIPTIRKRLVF